LDRRLGGSKSWSGRSGKEKILDFTGIGTPTSWSSSPQPVAIPTELSRLITEEITRRKWNWTGHTHQKLKRKLWSGTHKNKGKEELQRTIREEALAAGK
jgi:hypothetical protein